MFKRLFLLFLLSVLVIGVITAMPTTNAVAPVGTENFTAGNQGADISLKAETSSTSGNFQQVTFEEGVPYMLRTYIGNIAETVFISVEEAPFNVDGNMQVNINGKDARIVPVGEIFTIAGPEYMQNTFDGLTAAIKLRNLSVKNEAGKVTFELADDVFYVRAVQEASEKGVNMYLILTGAPVEGYVWDTYSERVTTVEGEQEITVVHLKNLSTGTSTYYPISQSFNGYMYFAESPVSILVTEFLYESGSAKPSGMYVQVQPLQAVQP